MNSISNVSQDKKLRNIIIRALLFSVLVFAGVTAGVYVGTALSNRPAPFEITPEVLDNDSYLKIGDKFPNFDLIAFETKEKTSLGELNTQSLLLLVFVSPSCEMCHHFVPYLSHNIINKLRPDIHAFTIIDSNDIFEPASVMDSLLVDGVPCFLTDRSSQRLEDGISAIPSIVGIGKDMKIKFLMTGYNNLLNADFINKYL